MRGETGPEMELYVSHRPLRSGSAEQTHGPTRDAGRVHHICSEFLTPYHPRPQCDHTLILWVGMELPEALDVMRMGGGTPLCLVHKASLIHSPLARQPRAVRTRMCLTGEGRPLITPILLILYRIEDHDGVDRMEAEKGCLRNGFSGRGVAKEPLEKTRALRHQTQRLPRESRQKFPGQMFQRSRNDGVRFVDS